MWRNYKSVHINRPFYCNTHSRRRRHSLMPDASEPFRHARCISSLQQAQSAAVQADRGQPLSSGLSIHCSCRFYSATWPDWFCSTSYAEIPVVVIESEIRVADFHQMARLSVINLIRLKLKDMMRTKRRLKYAKNHANWLIRFENVISQAQWPHVVASFFWPTL